MRRAPAFPLALLFVLSSPAYAPCQTKSAAPAAPVELRISGPRLIRYGQDLSFTITAVNRSAATVAISKRQNGTIDGTLSFRLLDRGGKEPPPPYVDPRDARAVCPLSSTLTDDDLVILKPGEKFVFTRNADPSIFYSFPRKGVYRLTVYYNFTPPVFVDPKERNNPALQGSLPNVSPVYEEALKQTPSMNLVSNEWQMTLY